MLIIVNDLTQCHQPHLPRAAVERRLPFLCYNRERVLDYNRFGQVIRSGLELDTRHGVIGHSCIESGETVEIVVDFDPMTPSVAAIKLGVAGLRGLRQSATLFR